MINPSTFRRTGRQAGFTMIELMLVLAIISMLVLIALPAYMDYTVRTKITEGIVLASAFKAGVVDFYSQSPTGAFPVNNAEAGMDVPANYATNIVSSISVGTVPSDGTITITYSLSELGTDNQLQFIPSAPSGAVEWTCQPAAVNGVSTTRLPEICR